MSDSIGFRCSALMHKDIKALAKKLNCSKTDAIIILIERGFESVNQTDESAIAVLNQRIDGLTKLIAQTLCVTNQIGELAGEQTMQNAEADFVELMQELGIK